MPSAQFFRLALLLIVLGTAATIALFALVPGLDLQVSGMFYDAATRKFPLATDTLIMALRDSNRVIDIVFGIIVGFAVLYKFWRPERPLLINGRTLLFLSLTFALAPGVAANVLFKENWSRPRPVHVTQFNGPAQFMPWYDPGGSCRRNCSFFSGEVSAAAWTLAPAVLAPAGPLRAAAIAGALVFTGVIAVVRITAGGHFLSDALFAFFATAFIVWLMYGAIYRGWWRDATDKIIEARMTRFAFFVRRLFGVK